MFIQAGKRLLETMGGVLQGQVLRHLGFLPLNHCFELSTGLLYVAIYEPIDAIFNEYH